MDFAVSYRTWAQPMGPGAWAAEREAEGWAALGVGDHIAVGGRGCLHAFPVLGEMAAHTSSVLLFTAFGNNLMRSPVEFAQVALTMQRLSGGRFEAGLGAGWAEDEIVAAGLDFPTPSARARRFREAILVVRDLLHGVCTFEGEHYHVDLAEAGPPVDIPPPLFAALGGSWTLRHIGPLVDRIEVFANAAAFRTGTTDFSALADITRDDFRRLIASAREANPEAKLGAGFFVAVGDQPGVKAMAEGFGKGFCQGLAGPAELVAETLLGFEGEGLDRITVLPPFHGTVEALAPLLLAR